MELPTAVEIEHQNLLWLPHWPSCRVIISHGILRVNST